METLTTPEIISAYSDFDFAQEGASSWFNLENIRELTGDEQTKSLPPFHEKALLAKIVPVEAITQVLRYRGWENYIQLDSENVVELTRHEQIEPVSRHNTSSFSGVATAVGDNERNYEAIESLYVSYNPRDRQVATRIIELYHDAIAEDERIISASLCQLADFFLAHPTKASFPKITLTPDGTLRVRWIQDSGGFVAIEFTGDTFVKMVVEIPREDGQPAQFFGVEHIKKALESARAMGALFV